MTDIISSLFFDIHPSNAKLTLFGEGICFLITFTVSAYSLKQMLLRFVAEGIIWLTYTTLYDHHSSSFDIAFHAIGAETHCNMR
jgi:hypothetical protein